MTEDWTQWALSRGPKWSYIFCSMPIFAREPHASTTGSSQPYTRSLLQNEAVPSLTVSALAHELSLWRQQSCSALQRILCPPPSTSLQLRQDTLLHGHVNFSHYTDEVAVESIVMWAVSCYVRLPSPPMRTKTLQVPFPPSPSWKRKKERRKTASSLLPDTPPVFEKTTKGRFSSSP